MTRALGPSLAALLVACGGSDDGGGQPRLGVEDSMVVETAPDTTIIDTTPEMETTEPPDTSDASDTYETSHAAETAVDTALDACVPSACPSAKEPDCRRPACVDGACAWTNEVAGTKLPDARQTAGDCKVLVCDGAGSVRSDNVADPPPSEPCIDKTCASGAVVSSPKCTDVSWARAWGVSIGDDSLVAVSAFSGGDAAVAGHFTKTINLGGGALGPSVSRDVWVARISASGSHVWSARIAATESGGFPSGAPYARAIGADAMGNTYVAGDITGSVSFASGVTRTATGGTDAFIAKYDPIGTLLWAKTYGGPGAQTIQAIAVGSSIHIGGSFDGTMDLGGTPLTMTGTSDAFVAKLNLDGAYVWGKRFGDTTKPQETRAIAIDPAGNVYVGGAFEGTLDLGVASFTTIDATDAWVAKLDAAGVVVFGRAYGANNNYDFVNGIVANAGGVVAVGQFSSSITFGATTTPTKGGSDAFLVALDSAGALRFGKTWGDIGSQVATSVALGPSGEISASGWFENTVDFGGGARTSKGNEDVFITKLTSAGTHVSSLQYGNGAIQRALATAADPLGNIFVGGTFAGELDFFTPALASTGGNDAFLAKLKP